MGLVGKEQRPAEAAREIGLERGDAVRIGPFEALGAGSNGFFGGEDAGADGAREDAVASKPCGLGRAVGAAGLD